MQPFRGWLLLIPPISGKSAAVSSSVVIVGPERVHIMCKVFRSFILSSKNLANPAQQVSFFHAWTATALVEKMRLSPGLSLNSTSGEQQRRHPPPWLILTYWNFCVICVARIHLRECANGGYGLQYRLTIK